MTVPAAMLGRAVSTRWREKSSTWATAAFARHPHVDETTVFALSRQIDARQARCHAHRLVES